MSVVITVDSACDGLIEAVQSTINGERSSISALTLKSDHNAVPNTIIVSKDGEPYLVLVLMTYNDFQLLLRHECANEYFENVHHAMKCPLCLVMIGQLTAPRQSRFWEGVAQLCVNETLFSILMGFDFAPTPSRTAEIIIAYGLKAVKHQTDIDPLVRTDGRRKCDPTDFHALYLDMLLEISSVSDRRAAVIASVFPSIYRLLEFIDSNSISRLRVEEYGENRSTSVLDPYITEVLSTNYNNTEANEALNELNELSKSLFA